MLKNKVVLLLQRSKTFSWASNAHSSSSRALIEPLLNSGRYFSTTATTNCVRRNDICHGFRDLPPKDVGLRRFSIRWRKMTTAASVCTQTKDGLKLLVTAGPHAQKMVGSWLLGSAAWVFSMVVLGGVTRLTRSGLSMTDWKFTGNLPPRSEEEWLLEFEKYKQSPEYNRVNKGMSIEDFKFIYWMEYAHRMWGRGLGVIFALPFSYFMHKGYITLRLGLRLSALFALGAGQGFIGWWMVKSGLEEPASEYVHPRVSPYRLAAHLTSAFVIYAGLFWTALSVFLPDPPVESLACVRGAARVKRLALPVGLVVGLTAVSGAFVAGNDAGRAYNTFPKMGDTWIPDDVFNMQPLLRNFFENTSTVQILDRKVTSSTSSSPVPMAGHKTFKERPGSIANPPPSYPSSPTNAPFPPPMPYAPTRPSRRWEFKDYPSRDALLVADMSSNFFSCSHNGEMLPWSCNDGLKYIGNGRERERRERGRLRMIHTQPTII